MASLRLVGETMLMQHRIEEYPGMVSSKSTPGRVSTVQAGRKTYDK